MLGASIVAAMMSSVAPIAVLQMSEISGEQLARAAVQSFVVGARSALDLRYDDILYDQQGKSISLRGVTVSPPAALDLTDCVVTIEAMTLVPSLEKDVLGLGVEADGAVATPGCAAEAAPIVLGMLGLDAMGVDRLSLDLEYTIGPSALSMVAHIQTPRTGTIDVSVEASGLHMVYQPIEFDDNGYASRPDPLPGGTLDRAEVTVSDMDTLRVFLPMAGITNDAAEQLGTVLTDNLGEVAETSAGKAFIDSAQTEAARFVEEGGALTLRMTAPEPVSFAAMADASDPEDMVPLLQPIVSARPEAAETLFAWDSLAALDKDLAAMSGAEKRAVAAAFATGRGVPRSQYRAVALYSALAEEGDAVAGLAAASLLADTDPARAYVLALDAGAAGAEGARLVLDRIEAGMTLEDILSMQAADAETADPEADLTALRNQARAAFDGQGARRHYADALFYASLATAAGDNASSHLQDRLTARFSETEAGAALVRAASDRALRAWIDGGLGAAFAE